MGGQGLLHRSSDFEDDTRCQSAHLWLQVAMREPCAARIVVQVLHAARNVQEPLEARERLVVASLDALAQGAARTVLEDLHVIQDQASDEARQRCRDSSRGTAWHAASDESRQAGGTAAAHNEVVNRYVTTTSARVACGVRCAARALQ